MHGNTVESHTVSPVGNGSAQSPSCAILILNYNGEKHLRHLLPTIRAAVEAHSAPVPVVVVDNRSTQADVEFLKTTYPEFEVVIAERNDYLFSLNSIVASRSEEVVILLNNDMRVEPGFIAPLLERLEDPDVFVVLPAIMNWDGSAFTTGKRLPETSRCWFTEHYDRSTEHLASFTLEAGCGAFRRKYFVQIGGFDTLYRPAYWEDVDLSYQAWARGWTCVYEPRSIIYHRVNGTIGDQPGLVEKLYHRNRCLFVLKNIGGWAFVLGYLALLPFRVRAGVRRGDHIQKQGIREAIRHMPHALLRRLRTSKYRKLNQQQIRARIMQPLDVRSSAERTPVDPTSRAVT